MMNNEIQYRILPEKWHSEISALRSVYYSDITIEVVKCAESLLMVRKLWDDLISRSSGATIFQTFDWLYNWWNFFVPEEKNSLHVLLVSSYGKLISIAPFYVRLFSLGGLKVFHQLRLMGSGVNSADSRSYAIEEEGVSDYLDLIVRDGFERKVSIAVAAYLEDLKYFFNEIDFQNVREESFIYNWLMPELNRYKFNVKISFSDVCPSLKVPLTVDDYLGSLKPGVKRKIKQVQKTNDANFGTEINNVDLGNYASSIQTLRNLHQKRWNELGHPGLFSDKRFEKFISFVSSEFLNKDWLWFKFVKYDGKVIAARLGFKFKERIYDYLSGFDNRQFVATLRPGIVLLYNMIKDAVSFKYRIVDFLRGAEEYKFELSSGVNRNFRIIANHIQSHKYRLSLFQLIKIYIKIMLRAKCELEIINLHIKNHGLLKFLFHYTGFCIRRLKSLKLKHKIPYIHERKISEAGISKVGQVKLHVEVLPESIYKSTKADSANQRIPQKKQMKREIHN